MRAVRRSLGSAFVLHGCAYSIIAYPRVAVNVSAKPVV